MISNNYLQLWGDSNKFSQGTAVVMADKQIKLALERGNATLEEIGNAKAIVHFLPTNKWFLIYGGWDNNEVHTAMMGAICGDVAGSAYERNNIKRKLNAANLINSFSHFTDDTVMTCAVANGLRIGLSMLPKNWMDAPNAEEVLFNSVQNEILSFGKKYPGAGYGESFYKWLYCDTPAPYGSWGNGSAMRASYAGWAAMSLAEAEKLGEISAAVTHNHPEGIKGARVVAGCIFLLRDGASKNDIRDYAGKFYDLNFTLRSIRKKYTFDVSCAGSVPQAIVAFLEGTDFADVIANAISIGGDSDTIAAIAGSIAEVIYPIPQKIRGDVIDKIDKYLLNTIVEAVDFLQR